MKLEMTCIGCPLGCALNVKVNGEQITVTGNTCPRGEKYAKNEAVCPKRTVTSTVAVRGGVIPRLSVKTAQDIPKDKIFDCMAAIRGVTVNAPVTIGTVILKNCVGTGVDVIATKSVEKIA